MNAAKWAGAVAAFAAIMGAGCADEQEALIVLHAPAWTDFDCVVDPQANATLAKGIVDVGAPTAYSLPVVLQNTLLSRSGSTTNSGIENGELKLEGVDVSLSMPQAPDVIDQVAAQNPAYVEFAAVLPTESLAPGELTGVLVEVLPNAASTAFADAIRSVLGEGARPQLVATLVFHATRTGNSAGQLGIIDAREFSFPIDMCINCLFGSCGGCPDMQCPPDTPFTGICGNRQDTGLWPVTCDPPDN